MSINYYASQEAQRIRAELKSHMAAGLAKHCGQSGCNYNSIVRWKQDGVGKTPLRNGRCRLGKGRKCPLANIAKRLYDLEHNEAYQVMYNQRLKQDVQTSLTEGDT